MKKILISGMGLGISLMSAPVPGIKDVCILLTIKIFNLKNPDVSPYFCCILGLIVFIICFKAYKNYRKNDHIINIVGLGNNGYWEKNNTNVETIDIRNWFDRKDKNKYIKQVLKETDIIINKYLASGLSFTSIAPIPLVSIIGKKFYKIKIEDYYEYIDSNSSVKKLNSCLFFPSLKLDILNKNSSCKYALISISTTVKIKEHQLVQFKKCLHYRFSISNPHQNSIYSRKQLSSYSNKIIEQINYISSLKDIKRIYIVFATQTSLPFEVSKQLNERMSKEVVVCHYQCDSVKPYEWGIILNGKNKENYIDLKEE